MTERPILFSGPLIPPIPAGRQHLSCLVVARDAEPDELVYAGLAGETRPGIVHCIRWYPRGRGRRR